MLTSVLNSLIEHQTLCMCQLNNIGTKNSDKGLVHYVVKAKIPFTAFTLGLLVSPCCRVHFNFTFGSVGGGDDTLAISMQTIEKRKLRYLSSVKSHYGHHYTSNITTYAN